MRHLIEVISYKDTSAPHSHSHTQIVLPLSGYLELEVDGHQKDIQFGEACLISAHNPHTYLAQKANNCLILNALPSWDASIPSSCHFVKLNQQTQSYLPFLSSLTADPNPLKLNKALSLLEHLLPIPTTQITQANARLEKAKRLLDECFHENISIAELANQVHLSTSQLTTLFKQHLKTTPKQYKLLKQLDACKYWLTHSDRRLEDIALEVGLTNASALTKHFRHHNPMTPGQFRAAHRIKS